MPKVEKASPKLAHKLLDDGKILINSPTRSENGALKIMFQRTVRVSDNGSENNLPPGLGTFSLYNLSDYKSTLPSAMSDKGGYFLPMHRK